MSPPSDDELDYLLSRGRLGGSQRDRILKTALGSSRDTVAAGWRRRIAWSAGTLAFATSAVVLLLTLGRSAEESAEQQQAVFRVKGPGDAPLIVMSCLGGRLDACPTGSKLAFALEGGRDKGGFLTSYAEPASPRERIWYLTNESVDAAGTDASLRVVRKAALIGETQPPGTYRVHAILSRRPVARDALAKLTSADALARVDLELVVVP
jgi:hypothetical protein